MAAAVRAAAEAAGSTEGAIDFVFQALSRVGQPRDPGHVTAAALCLEVRRLAEASFESAEEARERMTAWRMRSSEELGRIVYALIDFGVLCASADDKPEDFNGLFTLDEWFPVTSPT